MPKGQKPYKRRREDDGGAVERGNRAAMREAQDYEDFVERRIMDEEAGAVERGNRAAMREAEDYNDFVEREEYRNGGMVRGCKSSQMSGKGFRGTY